MRSKPQVAHPCVPAGTESGHELDDEGVGVADAVGVAVGDAPFVMRYSCCPATLVYGEPLMTVLLAERDALPESRKGVGVVELPEMRRELLRFLGSAYPISNGLVVTVSEIVL